VLIGMAHYLEMDGICFNADFIDHLEKVDESRTRLILKTKKGNSSWAYVVSRPKEFLEKKVKEALAKAGCDDPC
jgi:gamma-glutamylcyclotransferase (GGCT)/AIG2-like uncharacterized protein YtfP